MTNTLADKNSIALKITRQAVIELFNWAEIDIDRDSQHDLDLDNPCDRSIAEAKEIFNWTDTTEIKPLSLLFDRVKLDSKVIEAKQNNRYLPPLWLEENYLKIPYPQEIEPNDSQERQLKEKIKECAGNLQDGDWDNLNLLLLIVEKYGSFLSLCESENDNDIALIDLVRTTAAVAVTLSHNNQAEELSLIAGDLSGIQDFIYTISSDGALKSLRARSFFLELVTEEIVQQLLDQLNLPRTNIIYAGGGNVYILALGDEKLIKQVVLKISDRINQWLFNSFKEKVFLALDYLLIPNSALNSSNLGKHWSELNRKLAIKKHRKFDNQITSLLKPKPAHGICRICFRDDVLKPQPLNYHDSDSSPACWNCQTMFSLGDKLLQTQAIVRSQSSNLKRQFSLGKKVFFERLFIAGNYYYLYDNIEDALKVKNRKAVLLINNWQVDHYQKKPKIIPLIIGNYGDRIKEEQEDKYHFITAAEMAGVAEGIDRVGYLRMDVDRLGKIFASGLGEQLNLPRLTGLSRQMNYFFKIYLDSLVKRRNENLPQGAKFLSKEQDLTKAKVNPHLLFIYAGGDDLFISGAWNEIVEFAFDIYQSFRAYTGWNPDITLSGGVSINQEKYPLYQSARNSGSAESNAKDNGRDSLGLFGQVFKWHEWLDLPKQIQAEKSKADSILCVKDQPKPDIKDILSFVQKLSNQLELKADYSRSFIQNLLDTAKTQETKLKQLRDRDDDEISKSLIQATEYYLHLPKLAYALSRLPTELQENPDFKPIRQSLLNPRNAPYFRAIATWIELLSRDC